MKGFRHAALVVTAAYAITYGVLVLIESRWIEAYQLAGDRAKFPPQAAWMFAALHATMIFGAIAIVGFLLAILWFVCECFRSRRRRVPSQPLDTIRSSA
jgi:ABC-type transport system involved in cytochrome c biogenesis permease subunit